MNEQVWHILDVGSVWMKEFAAAMTRYVPTVCWSPSMELTGAFQNWERIERLTHPELDVFRFPLQRGYARPVISRVFPFETRLLKRLESHSARPHNSPLICSTPFYAPVAEKWPGPVIYYMTDLTASYEGLDPDQVKAFDRRLCRVATSVCPNSHRIAQYLRETIDCPPEKIHVVPNATRSSNLADQPLLNPGRAPEDIAHLARPLAGVIGNLSGNMDWLLLEQAVAGTPDLTWVFVGPTSMPIRHRQQSDARSRVMQMAHFTGEKPYGELQAYARAFDVAVLPYCKKEPTYSGSSTRFYEHLAACRPMVATRGFAELMEKPPLLKLVDTAPEMIAALEKLKSCGFDDGQQTARWEASLSGTWEDRARAVISTVEPALAKNISKIEQVV